MNLKFKRWLEIQTFIPINDKGSTMYYLNSYKWNEITHRHKISLGMKWVIKNEYRIC
jgi:hypothetical protein